MGNSGWNRSSGVPKPTQKKPSAMRGIVAGLVAVAVATAAVCYVLFSGDKAKKPVREDTKKSLIKEVTPAAAPTNAAPVKAKPTKTKDELAADFVRKYKERYGEGELPLDIKTHLYYLKNPPRQIFKARKDYPYLENAAERSIASLLYTEPGTFFLEAPTYGADFDQHFANAVASHIEIKPDDPEDVKAVKNFVTDMKKQIAEIVKKEGKKPSELMNEQGQLMYDLGRFEEQLAQDLRNATENPDMSDADVKDLFAAANVLRKKKGLEERPIPTLATRSLDLKRKLRRDAMNARRKAEKAAAAPAEADGK